ncbi:MAG: hypothetical protein ABIP30_13070 [Ferruginibacter sp.]
MNSFTKKLLGVFVGALFILAFTIKPEPVNFSGEWKLNESKSDMGQFANIVPKTIKVSQMGDSITMTKNSAGFNGEDVQQTETLSFDGKEKTSTVPPGTSTRKASAKWSDDGKSLIITWDLMMDFNGQTADIKGTEAWALSADGKSLTVENNSSSSFGDNKFKGLYEK